MKCEDIKILMMEYLYHEIDKKNKEALQNHLNQCSECMAEYTDLKQTSSNLKLWPDENHEVTELLLKNTIPKKSKRIFYRIATVAATVLIILSLTNFRLSIDNNGLDIGFSLFGSGDTDQIAASILENGSRVEQLQLMTELIQASNDRQKQEMVTLLTDFYQAIEMRRQADLKVITQGMETLRSTSDQRIEETEKTLNGLIQYTGSILDQANYIKSIKNK